MPRIALSILAGALVGCGSPYLKTASKFSDTASQSVTALQSASGFRSQLCHLAARYAYTAARIEGPVMDSSHHRTPIDSFETTLIFGETTTWAGKCAAPKKSDELVDNSLTALGAYATSLGKVAEDDFPGKNITDLGTDSSALAKALSDKSKASVIAASLSAPISSLAEAIGDHYKKKAVASIVAKSHNSVMALIAGIDNYLGVVKDEESADARKSLHAALLAEDGAVQPSEVIRYVEIATRWSSQIDDIDHAIASTRDVLKKLGDAETKLHDAAGKDDAPQLADVLRDLSTVIDDVQAVRAAINGKADN